MQKCTVNDVVTNQNIILNKMQLQKFGIEIRKIGNTENLYKDVDAVLKNYNIPKGSVNTDIQVQTIAHALQKMLKTDRHFSICTVRECVKISQIIISEERMNIYSAAHCLNWNEMLPDYRNMLVAMLLDDFRTILNPE